MTLVLVASGLWLIRHRSAENESYYGRKFPDPQKAFDFTLTDQNGKPFRLDSLRGKLVLMVFGFTHCPNICPTTLADLASVYRKLPPTAQRRLQVLFVSVDPERDTPRVLKDYVPFFDEHFIGLTGSPEQIAKTAKAYGAVYEHSYQSSQVAANYYTINHSTYLYVISPAGEWIALYNYEQLPRTDRILSDVKRFLAAAHG
jgi:protein SCO1/2